MGVSHKLRGPPGTAGGFSIGFPKRRSVGYHVSGQEGIPKHVPRNHVALLLKQPSSLGGIS